MIGWWGWWLDEEDVQRELMASRLREAALCFDNMKNANKKPGTKTETNVTGQRRAGTQAQLGKDGLGAGKRTAFSHFAPGISHLYPLNSTQVVDFPRMCNVSIFWGRAKNSRISGRGMIGRGMAKRGLGTNIGTCRVDFCGKITGCYAKVREVSRKSTK